MTPPKTSAADSTPTLTLSFENHGGLIFPVNAPLKLNEPGQTPGKFLFPAPSLFDNPLRFDNLWTPTPYFSPLPFFAQQAGGKGPGSSPGNPMPIGGGPSSGGNAASVGAAPAASPGMTKDQIWDLITDSLLLVEDMDLSGDGMTVNGGVGGCRYPEFSRLKDIKEDLKHCTVTFDPDTHGSVRLQIRKISGVNASRITGFKLGYDKPLLKDEFPSNQVRIEGFHFVPAPEVSVPFYEEVDPPTFKGFQLKYMPIRRGINDVPVIGTIIFEAAVKDAKELYFTDDYLSSWGLDDPQFYKDAHTAQYRAPQGVGDFMRLIRHADMNPPNWVNLNKQNSKPDLFNWLSLQTIDVRAHLRPGTLNIPNLGTVTVSRDKAAIKIRPLYDKLQKMEKGEERDELFKQYTQLLDDTARLEIKADPKQIAASLYNVGLSSAHFSDDRFDFELKGVTVQNLNSTLPPLQALVDQIKKGNFAPSFQLNGVHADKIVLKDKELGTTTTINNANIGSLKINGKSSIVVEGLSATKLETQHAGSGLKFIVKDPAITSATLSQSGNLRGVKISHIEGKSIELGYSDLTFKVFSGGIDDLNITEKDGALTVKAGAISSTGSIEYGIPSSNISLKAEGNSNLSGLEVSRTVNDQGENVIHGKLGLAGTVTQLQLKQNGVFTGRFSNTTFRNGSLDVTALIKPNGTPKLQGLQYSLDTQLGEMNIDEAKIGFVTLKPSKITNGHITIKHEDWEVTKLPSLDVGGTLKLNLNEMGGKNESFNIPGLLASGLFKNITIEGDAHLNWNQGDWLVETTAGGKTTPLQIHARLENGQILHDPHKVKGNDLSAWANNQVVQSDLKINSADLALNDVERIQFSTNSAPKSASGLKQVHVSDVRIDNINAGGVLWAKVPLFYYLRGLFPQIGNIGQGTQMKTSFIHLGDFEISFDEAGKPITTFKNFNTELYEVGGRNQYAKLTVPFLKISPSNANPVDTGDDPIQMDVSVKDPARGGAFQFLSVPRPLSERHSRIVPRSSSK
ncbi:MAG: hypothetical protein U1F57_04415 [bacterium]